MSPDSPYPSTQRRLWRFITAVTAVLAAFSLLTSVWLHGQQQDQRKNFVRMSCLEQNRRHDRTIHALNVVLARRLRDASPRERVRLTQSRLATELLIDALAPHQDCGARVYQATK